MILSRKAAKIFDTKACCLLWFEVMRQAMAPLRNELDVAYGRSLLRLKDCQVWRTYNDLGILNETQCTQHRTLRVTDLPAMVELIAQQQVHHDVCMSRPGTFMSQ